MKIILAVFLSIMLLSFSTDKPAYQIFDSNGSAVNYSQMVEKLKDADIVLFGELHDNPISHWLEYELTKDLYALKKENMLMGAEMFEADNQLILDEYLSGIISEAKFEDEARLWPNYKTDYKPLINFAKDNKIKFVADNIPRRYAGVVFSNGFEGLDKLSNEAKKYIAPLPVQYDATLDCYKSMMGMGGMGGQHANENLPKAQAIKDATMAYFVLQNWKKGNLLIHYNGSYHSDNHQGMVWYLKKSNKDLKILTIATTMQAEISKMDDESKNLADFVLVVPESMTRTNQ